ncbi:MAG: FAD-dependent oxidoreductase [Gaiellales bacterium]
MSETVAIVGAGITGLACAEALEHAVVVDRIPVTGGVNGWDDPDTRRLTGACGARFLLGATATRWDGGTLWVIGPGGVERIAAAALVIAGGTRPQGRAQLGIVGDRPAGVLPATAACHLAENGLPIGRRVVVYGGGDWAHRSAVELLHAGAEVTVLAPYGLLHEMPAGAEVREGDRVTAVRGRLRVERVELDDGRVDVECDGLVLAHGLSPNRNVDGAVLDGDRVIYAQPLDDPASVAGAKAAGRHAAVRVMELIRQGGTR